MRGGSGSGLTVAEVSDDLKTALMVGTLAVGLIDGTIFGVTTSGVRVA